MTTHVVITGDEVRILSNINIVWNRPCSTSCETRSIHDADTGKPPSNKFQAYKVVGETNKASPEASEHPPPLSLVKPFLLAAKVVKYPYVLTPRI